MGGLPGVVVTMDAPTGKDTTLEKTSKNILSPREAILEKQMYSPVFCFSDHTVLCVTCLALGVITEDCTWHTLARESGPQHPS